jgi:hypothetical protein
VDRVTHRLRRIKQEVKVEDVGEVRAPSVLFDKTDIVVYRQDARAVSRLDEPHRRHPPFEFPHDAVLHERKLPRHGRLRLNRV